YFARGHDSARAHHESVAIAVRSMPIFATIRQERKKNSPARSAERPAPTLTKTWAKMKDGKLCC
ncbi:MAG: hypothetical protein QF897_00185, partial [Gammaproteobacteria bacterium]|nr:hypothetical protein [Gammaproteobacteria bacterium]